MIELTQQEIIDRFDCQSKCRISYMGKKTKILGRLWQVDWNKCVALTILFDRPKSYLVDGDEAIRDGVRIVVKK
jgi:hypothetical protein